MTSLRRMPIRIRVTLAFSVAMALLLAGLGLFLYLRLDEQITETLDAGLEARADELRSRTSASGVPDLGAASAGLSEDDESFAQLLDTGGEVVESTSQLGGVPAIGAATLETAAAGPTFTEIPRLTGLEGPFRVLAVPVSGAEGEPLIAVVGASLDDRDEALSNLLTLLLVGGPISLLLASLAGYAAISAALRPVEAMRARAAAVTAEDLGGRLPTGPAEDELSRLAATLNEMLDRLETAVERERRFVDDASHELRTPLALHKTALELALRYEEGDAELRAAVVSSVEEVDRLIQLAEDLLVVARSEAGDLAINRERLPAVRLLGAVAARFEAHGRESGRSVSVDVDPALELDADPLRIEQALTNLVDNAMRHGAGDVRLYAEASPSSVRLHVSDEGEGFPPDFLAIAFERFSRADAARTSGGSGLGLAIVATIAGAHGGGAGARNAPTGADAWIELPRAGG